ncbi:MAG: App1 family protein [Tunicatimonas sp.]
MKKVDIKLYRGYVNDKEIIVFGHVFWTKAPDSFALDTTGLHHAYSVIRMFRLDPINNAKVTFRFQDLEVATKTTEDGYFRFTLPYTNPLKSGWHSYRVRCAVGDTEVEEESELLKPYNSKLGIISDIDDTFLISYSSRFFKKLYVMLFRNVNRRKIFDEVVDHYKALSRAGQDSPQASNAFFYVSSSEWNLYSLITHFAKLHDLPKAVIKLKSIKTSLLDFFASGRGNHDHKFIKIKDIMTFYPQLEYVLLGDDSQHDPYLYERVCKHFPMNVRAIYIRRTAGRRKPKVVQTLHNIESLNVATCYFENSSEAIAHSQKLGIIN